MANIQRVFHDRTKRSKMIFIAIKRVHFVITSQFLSHTHMLRIYMYGIAVDPYK